MFIPFITEFIMIFVMHRPLFWDVRAFFFVENSFWQEFVIFPKDSDWGTLISNVVWAFGGFDSMGVLAGNISI